MLHQVNWLIKPVHDFIVQLFSCTLKSYLYHLQHGMSGFRAEMWKQMPLLCNSAHIAKLPPKEMYSFTKWDCVVPLHSEKDIKTLILVFWTLLKFSHVFLVPRWNICPLWLKETQNKSVCFCAVCLCSSQLWVEDFHPSHSVTMTSDPLFRLDCIVINVNYWS